MAKHWWSLRPNSWTRQPPVQTVHLTFERVLGTRLDLTLRGDGRSLATAEQAVLAETERLEQVFSRYRADSELNVWQAGRSWQPVSPDLGAVLALSLHWQQVGGGSYHPGSDALSLLWQAASAQDRLPDPVQLARVVAQLADPPYELDQSAGRACKLTLLPLNFNALAKGYIADRAAEAARRVPGLRTVLINLGGDLRHLGEGSVLAQVEDPWQPHDNASPLACLPLSGEGLATSGGSRRGFQVAGQRYSHVLDPRSGDSVTRLCSVSVLAPDAASADALATILSVLPPADGLALAERLPGVAALLINRHAEQWVSPRWASRISAARHTTPPPPSAHPTGA